MGELTYETGKIFEAMNAKLDWIVKFLSEASQQPEQQQESVGEEAQQIQQYRAQMPQQVPAQRTVPQQVQQQRTQLQEQTQARQVVEPEMIVEDREVSNSDFVEPTQLMDEPPIAPIPQKKQPSMLEKMKQGLVKKRFQ